MSKDNVSPRDPPPPAEHPQPYTRRVLLAVGILLAVLLRGAAGWVAGKTGLSVNWSLAIVIVGLTGAFVLLGWLLAPGLARQANEFAKKLPDALEKFEQRVITKYPGARQMLGMA